MNHLSRSFPIDEDDENEFDDDDDDDDDEGSSGDDETTSDDESHDVHSITTPSTISQRRHSDTLHSSYPTAIVKRRCTYSSIHDEEQKRSVLVESYRKLRSVKKPKLQVSLLICNLIKHLEKTFTKTPPFQQEQDHVQYYQPPPPPPPPFHHHHHHRTTYRSSSSDSIYMSPLENDQQYSSTNYSSEKLFSPMNDLRSTMYPSSSSSTTDAYWLAQSNFAVPVVSTTDDDDNQIDESLHGDRNYLDLSDNTLSSNSDCSCTSTPSKTLVDTNNNTNNDDYYLYHHPSTSISESTSTFFYPHNTVDLITTA